MAEFYEVLDKIAPLQGWEKVWIPCAGLVLVVLGFVGMYYSQYIILPVLHWLFPPGTDDAVVFIACVELTLAGCFLFGLVRGLYRLATETPEERERREMVEEARRRVQRMERR